MSKLLEAVEALKPRYFTGEGWQSAPVLDRAEVLDLIRQHEPQDEVFAVKDVVETFERRRTKALDDLHGAYVFLLKKQKQAGKESKE